MGLYIDKIADDFEKHDTIETQKLAGAIIFDSVNELKKLEGESFIKSAIELYKVISEYDGPWIFEKP